MYPDGTPGRALDACASSRSATGRSRRVCPPSRASANTFRAENFDVLYDSPFLAGNFKILSFDVAGVPHRIVIDGEGNYDAERTAARRAEDSRGRGRR